MREENGAGEARREHARWRRIEVQHLTVTQLLQRPDWFLVSDMGTGFGRRTIVCGWPARPVVVHRPVLRHPTSRHLRVASEAYSTYQSTASTVQLHSIDDGLSGGRPTPIWSAIPVRCGAELINPTATSPNRSTTRDLKPNHTSYFSRLLTQVHEG